MRAVYINLENATERRAGIERSFAGVPHDGWDLARFPAVPAAEMVAAAGALAPTQKACFESHRRVIGDSLGDAEPLFILEDDVVFSRRVFPFLSVAAASWADDWDLLFTDVAFPAPAHLQVALEREELAARDEVSVIPLNGTGFSGAMAYMVRGKSKAKLHALLGEARSLDEPYDLLLRRLCDEGRINAYATLPLLTIYAPEAEHSQIVPGPLSARLRSLYALRQMLFIERDMDACRQSVAALNAQTPEFQRMVGVITGAMLLKA